MILKQYRHLMILTPEFHYLNNIPHVKAIDKIEMFRELYFNHLRGRLQHFFFENLRVTI